MADRRDRMAQTRRWYDSIDDRRMLAEFRWEDADGEEYCVNVNVRFEVCGTCDGRGRHVNPSIDSHGITREEMDEQGPGFLEDYMSGTYDVDCYECHGRRVVPVPDEKRNSQEILDAIHDRIRSERRCFDELEAERRFGA